MIIQKSISFYLGIRAASESLISCFMQKNAAVDINVEKGISHSMLHSMCFMTSNKLVVD
jgi:hypothetical protein